MNTDCRKCKAPMPKIERRVESPVELMVSRMTVTAYLCPKCGHCNNLKLRKKKGSLRINSTNAKDYLPLVEALARGETIQSLNNGVWYDTFTPLFDGGDYRIKPKPLEAWVVVVDNKSDPFGFGWPISHKERAQESAEAAKGRIVHMREVP